MNHDLATFMLSALAPPPAARSSARLGRTYSGAAISSSSLVIATVKAVGIGKLRLCEERTHSFLLADRSQPSIRRFFNEVEVFVRKRRLTHALLRVSPGSGKYTAAPTTYMIEGALNLIPGLHVEFAAFQMVLAWARREGGITPCYPADTPRRLRDTFSIAIQSACLSEARERDPVYRSLAGKA